MSQTYSIGCNECKKHLWIAQGSYDRPEDGHIYSGDAKTMKALYKFLIEHKGHDLVFEKSSFFDDDYKETEDETQSSCRSCEYWKEDSEYKGLGVCGNDKFSSQIIYGHVDIFLISGEFLCKHFKQKRRISFLDRDDIRLCSK